MQGPSRGKPTTTPVWLSAYHVYKGVSGGAPAWTLDPVVIRRAGGGHSWYPSWDIRLCLGLNEHKTMVKFT